MVDLYTCLRVNRFVILSGAPLSGKTTIWNTMVKAINSLQTKEAITVIFISKLRCK